MLAKQADRLRGLRAIKSALLLARTEKGAAEELTHEVEIKVLLGTEEAKDLFMSKVKESFPKITHTYTESQRNHYFQ